jgi:hypothetical protein
MRETPQHPVPITAIHSCASPRRRRVEHPEQGWNTCAAAMEPPQSTKHAIAGEPARLLGWLAACL